jgi:hypothetical protein
MKAYWGSGGIAPCILNLSTRWRSVVSFMPWPLYPQGKSPWYPLYRRLGGPQNWSGHFGEEKNSQPLLRLKPLVIQPIAHHYITELSWLLECITCNGKPALEHQHYQVTAGINCQSSVHWKGKVCCN